LLLELILHQSDISNPLKPFDVGKAWAWLVLEEFFAQGDKEKELGIPVGMLNDRNKINRYGSQHGFITFLVSPLILSAANVFQTLLPLCDNMAMNLWEWHRQWTMDAHPPAADVDKRAAEVNKIEEKVKTLAKRAGDDYGSRRTRGTRVSFASARTARSRPSYGASRSAGTRTSRSASP